MGKRIKKLAKSGRAAARKAYDRLEAKVMETVGRRAVKSKLRGAKTVAKNVAKRAAKQALIAGGMAAAGVVVKEIRKRKRRKPA